MRNGSMGLVGRNFRLAKNPLLGDDGQTGQRERFGNWEIRRTYRADLDERENRRWHV
jgi:hypothetical protein